MKNSKKMPCRGLRYCLFPSCISDFISLIHCAFLPRAAAVNKFSPLRTHKSQSLAPLYTLPSGSSNRFTDLHRNSLKIHFNIIISSTSTSTSPNLAPEVPSNIKMFLIELFPTSGQDRNQGHMGYL